MSKPDDYSAIEDCLAPLTENMNVRHVYPLEDIMEHDIESVKCKCDPLLEIHNGTLIVIHRSWDNDGNTEFFEDVHGEVVL